MSYKKSHKKSGFSLLELMFAMTLSVVLLVGVLQVYSSVKSLYQTHKATAELQENMRFSAYMLNQSVSIAGYAGCARLRDLQIADLQNIGFTPETSLQGFDSANLPQYLHDKNVVSGTDVIIVQRADADETRVISAGVDVGATTINVLQNPATRNDAILLLSNCTTADLFSAKNYDNGAVIQSTVAIKHKYAPGTSVVGRYAEQAYFVSNTGREDERGHALYGLFVVTNRGDKEELCEDISRMKIKYGVDRGARGVIDDYYDATYVTNNKLWTKVVSVIITLTQQQNAAFSQEKNWDIYIKLRNR
jgi:type IV pilus assembly protein PilW